MSVSLETDTTRAKGETGNADAQRAAARRTAWALAIVVVLIYAGYLAWNVWRSAGQA